MELVKDIWHDKDRQEFINFLESFKREDKVTWTKNIINTKMEVLAIKSPELNKISREIRKGNFLSFLDLALNDYYENTVINGNLIVHIKDFDVMKQYLDRYSKTVDNWAGCDLLKFNIKKNEERFFQLAEEYINSELTFVRRIGIIVLFKFIEYDSYVDRIYEILNKFFDEKEYYVNMANAWLLCELFIKRREKTVDFFKNNRLNSFTINKAISKCRDSFRVSDEDKKFLLNFRR